ncbi:hypothetical protein Nmel_002297, partial [Mimus melanotis]
MDTHKIIPAEEEGSRVFSIEQFLWFLPTSREDSGNYTCVTHFSSNRTKSYTVSVQVHSYKPGRCFPSRTHYPNDTGRGRVSCPTMDNYKNATIVQWYKDCKPLQGQRYLKEGKYIYIENPRREDDGYYTCQFIYTHKGNVFNVSATRIFISEVKHSPLPPRIIFPKNKDVVEADLEVLPYVLLITGSLVLLGAIAISLILYQSFQVDIVLLYREIFQPHPVKDDGKIYDAYVIYPKNHTSEANFVEYFVYQVMPDILENKCGYKLCIYGRDIYPGEDAASAIEKRMQKSRRLIILLTHQLINSKENAYDQHIALYNALIQNDTKVILLEMETIGTYGKLQESLRFIIKQQGTIKWKEEHTVHLQSPNSKFWKQVRYRMPLTNRPSHSANTRRYMTVQSGSVAVFFELYSVLQLSND